MATDTTPTPSPGSTDAEALANRRLLAWTTRHPGAAALAALASLAVRIDSALLRRLRLQLLPRAEPGIEADVWFSGLHESRGRDGVVLDAGVQRLLRLRLVQQTAAAGSLRPLDAAWQITQALHADAPEAIRTEEALTWEALRAGDGLPERIAQLLAPALAAMAGGGDARALEVARWAQRAVPRLPDAARQHPSALALWLAALMRLGLPASHLPDTADAGLPPALQWLLPPGQMQATQRLALTPFDDALLLRPLAHDAPSADHEITLPRTRPLLLALRVDGAGAGSTPLLQGTLGLEPSATETRVPLPPTWQALDLHALNGARWRLQRQAGVTLTDDAPLPWQRMQAQVLGPSGPGGLAVFVSTSQLVTVVDTVPPALVKLLREGGETSPDAPTMDLAAWDARGQRHTLRARAVALDLRSSLALLQLQQPFDDALPVELGPSASVAPGTRLWTPPGLHGTRGQWPGQTVTFDGPGPLMPPSLLHSRLTPRHAHFALRLPVPPSALPGMAGAPVFAGRQLVGIADLAMSVDANASHSTQLAVPVLAVTELLAWARQPERQVHRVLLQYPVDESDLRNVKYDNSAVQRIVRASDRARLQLAQDDGAHGAWPAIDWVAGSSFLSTLVAAVRLVTPGTSSDRSPDARLRLLALAARRWAQPDFAILTLGHRVKRESQPLPPPLAGLPLVDIDSLDDETLARRLLDLADPPPVLQGGDTQTFLRSRMDDLARPFARSRRDLDALRALVDQLPPAGNTTLADIAELIVNHWNRSSRLDATPLVELLAQLALPVSDLGFFAPLRDVNRGALVLNVMPVQFARVLIARAHVRSWPPPCIVVRDQTWSGAASVDAIENQVINAMGAALDCAPDEGRTLLQRLNLAPWVLVTTRPLPDQALLRQLEARLPSVRWMFLAGPEPDLDRTASAIGAQLLPLLPERADMVWLQGYKRLMEWAHPRKSPRSTQTASRKPLRK